MPRQTATKCGTQFWFWVKSHSCQVNMATTFREWRTIAGSIITTYYTEQSKDYANPLSTQQAFFFTPCALAIHGLFTPYLGLGTLKNPRLYWTHLLFKLSTKTLAQPRTHLATRHQRLWCSPVVHTCLHGQQETEPIPDSVVLGNCGDEWHCRGPSAACALSLAGEQFAALYPSSVTVLASHSLVSQRHSLSAGCLVAMVCLWY